MKKILLTVSALAFSAIVFAQNTPESRDTKVVPSRNAPEATPATPAATPAGRARPVRQANTPPPTEANGRPDATPVRPAATPEATPQKNTSAPPARRARPVRQQIHHQHQTVVNRMLLLHRPRQLLQHQIEKIL